MEHLRTKLLLLALLLQCLQAQQQPITVKELFMYISGGGFLKGTWTSNRPSEPFGFLSSSSGVTHSIFLTSSATQMVLLDPEFREGRQVIVLVELQNYNDTEISWGGATIPTYAMQDKYRVKAGDFCNAQMNMQITFRTPASPDQYITIVSRLVGKPSTIDDPCDFDLELNYTYQDENFLGVSLYLAFVAVITVVSTFFSNHVIKMLIANQQYQDKFSTITLGFLTYNWWYYFALNLFSEFPDVNSPLFMIVPSLCFLVSYFYVVKLFMLVWRFNNIEQLFDQQQRKKALLLLLFKYYLGFAVFCALVFIYIVQVWMLILTGFFMVPQIIHNAIKGRPPKFIPHYIFGVLAINYIYPVYLRGCPQNFMGLYPSATFIAIWTSQFVIQISILYCQHRFGPRFFIPKCFLPKAYNYFKKINIQTEQGECYICLCDLTQDPLKEENTSQTALLNNLMITPCKHQFHESCLKSWMDVKLECPACRKALPILQA